MGIKVSYRNTKKLTTLIYVDIIVCQALISAKFLYKFS